MRECTEKEFLQMLEVPNQINFIAGAITPWHALGINATIYQLQQKGIELIGYIMVVSHPETGRAIDEKNFYLEETKIEVIEISAKIEHKSIQQKIKDKVQKYAYYMKNNIEYDRTLYWAAPYKPSYELIPKVAEVIKNCRIKVIVTDEGLADYLMTPYRAWQHVMKRYKSIWEKLEASWILFIRDPYFNKKLQQLDCLQYSQLLKGKRGAWKKNEESIDAFRNILKKQKIVEDYSAYSNCILINTDMMYEGGMLLRNVDVPIYERICQYGLEEMIPVRLKSHPREQHLDRYTKLKCDIRKENGVAQETILSSLDEMPYCLIGTGSTTLVTAHLLFGVDVISINRMISRKDLLEETYFDNFNKTFSNLMMTPSNMEELIRDLNCIKERHERNQENLKSI